MTIPRFDLLSPGNNSVAVPLAPTLDWTEASGLFTVTYNLQVSEQSSSEPVLEENGLAQTGFNIPAGVLAPATAYDWSVVAVNPGGQTPSTPKTVTFTTLIPGDLNLDGAVDGSDLGLSLGLWDETDPVLDADLNGDGTVDGADLGLLLGNWGGPV